MPILETEVSKTKFIQLNKSTNSSTDNFKQEWLKLDGLKIRRFQRKKAKKYITNQNLKLY